MSAKERGQSLAEGSAFIFPVLLFLLFDFVNVSIYALAGMNASNAANYGARRASVAQDDALTMAYEFAEAKLDQVPIGTYTVTVSGGGGRGNLIQITIEYQVTNYLPGLFLLLDVYPTEFRGQTVSHFRQEGW